MSTATADAGTPGLPAVAAVPGEAHRDWDNPPPAAAGGLHGGHRASPGPGARWRPLGRLRRRCARDAAASTAVAALVAVFPVVIASAAPAAGPPPSEQAYSQAKTAAEDHSNWLSFVNGGTPIWQLSIPGTHDSYTAALAGHGWDYQTQTLPVPEQLKMGIRALDLRIQANNQNDFDVEHGGASAKITLSGVLSQLRDFLSAHPAEFVILRAKVDKEGANFTGNFNSILGKYQGILWRGNADATFQNPPLDQVRGKVILLKDFPATPATINSYGMKWSAPGFVIQDKYNFVSNWDLYPKWELVLSNWNSSVTNANTPEAAGKGYINFLSGSGASFPYFVASGRSSPTGPLLSTGRVVTTGSLRDPASGPYPDFHRVSCFLGLCTVAFTGTNLLMYDVLSAQNRAGANHGSLRGRQGMGLIYIDFPGQPLVNSIIAQNPASLVGAQPTPTPTPAVPATPSPTPATPVPPRVPVTG